MNVQAHKLTRSKINGKIVELMKILPRAQYVGYTATPFANVFVDPSNAEDLFPKDFVLSLPRPPGYMGVADFYDLGDISPEDPESNRNAFVFDVIGADSAPANLQKAIDAFVLTGALKLFRRKRGVTIRSPHHTMLVHKASTQAVHRAQVLEIRALLAKSDYRSGPALRRLEKLYKESFAAITKVRAPEMPVPSGFASLGPFIGDCLSRINQGEPVMMVNSDEGSDTPDFDGAPVWKILVGGTKLSRGYTVEGLTISYYRRSTKAGDTLMQMGRWFGFREGYGDLVRLFLGVREPIGKSGKTRNLYDDFGAVCKDEEHFREQLKRYASMVEPRCLPIQVPPLVSSYGLMPTAKNKMFNARIKFQNYSGESSESTLAPTEPAAIKRNWAALTTLLAGVKLHEDTVSFELQDKPFEFDVITGILGNRQVVRFLEDYSWSGKQRPLQHVIEFLQGTGAKSPGIDQWLFLAPLQANTRRPRSVAGPKFSIFQRKRVEGGRVGIYSEPRHKALAEYASLGERRDKKTAPLKKLSDTAKNLFNPRQAVLLYYTVKTGEEDKGGFPAFVLQYPKNGIALPIQFGVIVPGENAGVVVPVQKASARARST